MSFKTISILGCGWLGLPLGRHLKQEGYCVKGSTTTPNKLEDIKAAAIDPYLIRCDPQVQGEDLEDFFKADALFLNIPFRRNLKDPNDYKKQIQSVIGKLESSPIEFVIFASSTSIYPDLDKLVVEDEPFDPPNKRAEVLCEIEQSFMDNKHFAATILRFAGLYGDDRKVGRFLAGQNDLPNGQSPVNLIHLDDCIGIVAAILKQNIRGEIFNACSDGHPTREELYTQAAFDLGVSPPTFDPKINEKLKTVSNEKLKRRLDYHLKHPDPLSLDR